MSKSRPQLMLALCMLTGACATTPSVTVTYYLPKAQTTIQIVQTVACNAEGSKVFSLSAATSTPAYLADVARPQSFVLSDLNHSYADADTSFTLTPDGRLLTVNSQQTGAGEAFVKAGIGALTAIGALSAPAPAPAAVPPSPAPKSPVQKACQAIHDASPDKPLALTYNLAAPITFTNEFGQSLTPVPDPPSAGLASDLAAFLPTLTVNVGPKPAPQNAARYVDAKKVVAKAKEEDAVLLTLADTGPVELTVLADARDGKPPKTVLQTIVVAPLPSTYSLPVPRGALFGKRNFNLTLTDSGAVTAIGYAAGSGATDAATSVSDVLAPFAAKTAAQKAQEAKDEADLIAQQQRLLKCQASLSDCSS